MKHRSILGGLAAVALLFAACSSTASTPAASGGGGGGADRSGILIEVVTHGQASDPFWSIFKNGVDQAGKDMGVKVNYSAPDTFDMIKMARSSTPPSPRTRKAWSSRSRTRPRSGRASRRPSPRDPGDLGELRLGRLRQPRRPDPRRAG